MVYALIADNALIEINCPSPADNENHIYDAELIHIKAIRIPAFYITKRNNKIENWGL